MKIIICSMLWMIGLSGMVGATLINDVLTMGHYYPYENTLYTEPSQQTTVQAGTTDRLLLWVGHYYVNPEANQILIDFNKAGNWTANAFNGLVITGISQPIVSVTTTSNWAGWNDSHITFSPGVLRFNWQGMISEAGTYIYATIQQGTVPEITPAISLFLGFLLLTLFFYRGTIFARNG